MNNEQETPRSAELVAREIELLKARQEAEFALSPAGQEMRLLKAKQEAEFALTPVGQELQRFQTNQRMGQMYAQSTLVPESYRGNVANCAIAVDMATRMNANALMVMQNLYIVHGTPSWSSKFLVATINTCGRFEPLKYECNGAKGDALGWRAYTYALDDRERKHRLDGSWVTWAMVKAEGWDKKNGSKWITMPEQMFRYRAAAFWQRAYAPEISMGFSTVEEVREIEDAGYVDLGAAPVKETIAEAARTRARAAVAVPPTPPAADLFVDAETGEVTES